MKFYGYDQAGHGVELPVGDEVIDLSVDTLVEWAGALIGHAIDACNLDPAADCGLTGGSLTGEMSEAWTLVNIALHHAAKARVV